MRNRKKYPSDHNPRCSVCRIIIASGNRCESHQARYKSGRDYSEFLAMPIPSDGATHAEIASVMGITAERVRQIEATAFRKLGLDARAIKLFRELIET